ncbi:fructose-specific PTS transporter subunit EIIC [Spiroplasma platyhelix]|uniref:PTS transporter subunit EIIC n=1 Tax=Spiroplasma platyhelix PALS-1 TaxID=1276218 RepID=A0A846TT09_9MOLU|nr:fructose-specific PTS transporter subunit EIIC [Spiroplasma platyhelix]MBE4704272.1 PTS system fructose-specific EIIB'BC component [Spiroplasma platyhelix PALS-1]NKE38645.1 PTS transporter subunit EIIC [Spiroplasma platyhelix PALS-1]UJB28856.1 PTS system fructose-specific IIABC component [Spiroplasma platyhelix PALS-1]
MASKATSKKQDHKEETNVKFPEVIAITACPTGIAHTYMAKEKILEAAKELKMTCKVETQGRSGNEDVLTAEEINHAKVIIFAADKALIGVERFNGKQVLEVGTKDAILDSKKLINNYLEGKTEGKAKLTVINQSGGGGENIEFSFKNFKYITRNLLAGVSRMLPFVVAGGIILGIGFLLDSGNSGGDFGVTRGVAAWFSGLGKVIFSMMIPILGAYICYAIVGPQGLLPGMVAGLIANAPEMLYKTDGTGWTNTWGRIFPSIQNFNSGFFGAIIGAYLVAFVVYGLTKGMKKMPKSLQGVRDIVFIPVISALAAGVIMFVINIPLGYLNYGLGLGLTEMAKHNLSALAGLIVGVMMAVDMGGPINKAAYVFGTATIDASNTAFDSIRSTNNGTIFMATAMIAGMVPPLAIALSTRIFKRYWSKKDVEGGNTNWFLSACFITEGAIPYAAEDPKRVIPSCVAGSAVTGAILTGFGVTLSAPHGGVFVFPLLGIQDNGSNWFTMPTQAGSMGIAILIAFVALFAGALISAAILGFWRMKNIKDGTLILK